MKVKSLIAAVLMTTSLSTFAVDLTLTPVYTVVDVVRSVLGVTVGTVTSPFASTAASSQLREQELKAIRDDANTFAADGKMTKNLASVIESLNAQEALADKSPEELVAIILLSI